MPRRSPSAAFGHKTVEYRLDERAVQLDHGPAVLWMDPMFGGRGNQHDENL